jgi:hypothetical protein
LERDDGASRAPYGKCELVLEESPHRAPRHRVHVPTCHAVADEAPELFLVGVGVELLVELDLRVRRFERPWRLKEMQRTNHDLVLEARVSRMRVFPGPSGHSPQAVWKLAIPSSEETGRRKEAMV